MVLMGSKEDTLQSTLNKGDPKWEYYQTIKYGVVSRDTIVVLEQGLAATGKAAISRQESQKKQYLKRSRRESSTTALKAASKTGGLSYPHKGKGVMVRGIEYKGQKGSDRGSGAHTHDQRREAWKTAESCSMTSKRQFKVQMRRLSQLGFFWVTVGIGP